MLLSSWKLSKKKNNPKIKTKTNKQQQQELIQITIPKETIFKQCACSKNDAYITMTSVWPAVYK